MLPNFELTGRKLVVVYPNRRFLTFKARALIDFLFKKILALERQGPAKKENA